MTMEAKTRRWGNSLGVVIPAEIAEKLNLKPEETILIDISKKSNALKELFGSIKLKKSTEQILKEGRAELEGKWLK